VHDGDRVGAVRRDENWGYRWRGRRRRVLRASFGIADCEKRRFEALLKRSSPKRCRGASAALLSQKSRTTKRRPDGCTNSHVPAAGEQRYPVAAVRIPLAVTTRFATACGSESGRPARLASRFQGAPIRIQSRPTAKRRDSPGSSVPSKRSLPCSLRCRTESQHRPLWGTKTRVRRDNAPILQAQPNFLHPTGEVTPVS
jgi:hypothetical protein